MKSKYPGGYIVMCGQPGCLPDSYDYCITKREVMFAETAARRSKQEVSIVTAEEFCRSNGHLGCATLDDLARLLA